MILAQGAEAIIEKKKDRIIKTRPEKKYRLPIIDERMRKLRTRAEARILERLIKTGVPVPEIHEVDEKSGVIEMQYIEGKKLRDVLKKSNWEYYADTIAHHLKAMHGVDVVHGDLTTSNMIVEKETLYVIDFGLSHVSPKVEDKAVDLHLLKRALDSYHSSYSEEMFMRIKEKYGDEIVLKRLEAIEKRGRYKMKMGS